MTETSVSLRFDKAVSNLVRNDTLAAVMHEAMVEVGAPKRTAEEKAYLEKFQKTVPEENILHDPGMTPLLDREFLENLIKKDRFGEFIVPFQPNSITQMGSSDTGDVSYVTPLAQCYTATFPIGTTAHSWQWVAMGQSPVALSGMYYAARVMAESTKKVMEEPALLDRAKQELSGRLGGTSYECPIPKDVWPTKYAK